MAPVSWRDVYQLLDEHRKESREDHEDLGRRLAALEAAELVRRAEKQQRGRFGGFAKNSVALIVSILGGVTAVIAWFK